MSGAEDEAIDHSSATYNPTDGDALVDDLLEGLSEASEFAHSSDHSQFDKRKNFDDETWKALRRGALIKYLNMASDPHIG